MSLSGPDNQSFDIHIPENTPVPPRLCRHDSISESCEDLAAKHHAPLASMSSGEEDLNEEGQETNFEPVNSCVGEGSKMHSSSKVTKDSELSRVKSESDIRPVFPHRDKIKDFKEWEELFKHAKSTPV